MNCEEARRLLQEYAGRELEPEQRRRTDEHLVECEDCRRELALVALLVSSLDSRPVFEPSPGFSARVMGALPRRHPVPHPAWTLFLLPVLGVPAWLFRLQLGETLVRLAGWLGLHGTVSLPRPAPWSLGQLGLAAGVIVAGTLALTALGGWLYWREFEAY